MTKKYFPITFLMLVYLWISLHGFSQNTIGLIQQGNGLEQPGYILFAPVAYNKTYLIDKCGLLVHSWDSNYKPGLAAHLLPDGNLLRSGNTQNSSFNYGGGGGIIEKIDWNGNVIWSYLISTDSLLQHHDIYPMPNGNVLALVWQKKTVIQVLQEGRDSLTITDHFLNEKIIEIQPIGLDSAVIVWEWNLWDHFIQDYDSTKQNYGSVIDHPELFNINHQIDVVNNPDWLHLNSVFYNPALNQIIVSSRTNNEFYILDHSTSTIEAASHAGGVRGKGGDILYRWGNPEVYNRGSIIDRKLFGQHSVSWIPDGLKDGGKIMVFNNGANRPGGNYSSVEVIEPPIDSTGAYSITDSLAFLPVSQSWSYAPTVSIFSANISGSQRLSNGNTLITYGVSGRFIEIDSLKNKVWEYKNPVNGNGPASQGSGIFINSVFRAIHYDSDYSGFQNHPLTPGLPIELNPSASTCSTSIGIEDVSMSANEIKFAPNPNIGIITVHLNEPARVSITNVIGQEIKQLEVLLGSNTIEFENMKSGIYFLKFQFKNGKQKIVKTIKN